LSDQYGVGDRAAVLAVQADGKVILAGTAVVPGANPWDPPLPAIGLTRHNADGSLDKTFGRGGGDGDGKVSLSVLEDRSAGHTDYVSQGAADIVLLPDGKFLVAASRWGVSEVDGGDLPQAGVGGQHTVRLVASGQSGPNVDSLTVTPPASTPRLEVEDAALKGAVVGKSYPGYTGRG
jgi:hypothetical protein